MTRDEILAKYSQGQPSPRDALLQKYVTPKGDMLPQKMQDRVPEYQPTQNEVDQDTAKTVLSTPARVVAGVAGMPGLVEEYAGKAAEYLGGPQQTTPRIFPTPDELMQKARGVLPSKVSEYALHEPETNTAKGVGMLMDVITPGLGNKTAYGARAVARNAIDTGQFAKDVQQAHDVVKAADVRFDLGAYRQAAHDLDRSIAPHTGVTGPVKTLLDKVVGEARMRPMGDANPTFAEIEKLRQEADDIVYAPRGSVKPKERSAAAMIRDHLIQFRDNAPVASHNTMLTRDQLTEAMARARGLSQKQIKARAVSDVIDNSLHAVSSKREGIVTRGVDRLLENKYHRKGFTEDQISQLQKVRSGGAVGRIGDALGVDLQSIISGSPVRALSALGGTVLRGSGVGSAALFGIPGAAAVGTAGTVLGTAAKLAKPAMQRRIAESLVKDIILGKGKNVPEKTKKLARALQQVPYLGVGATTTQAE